MTPYFLGWFAVGLVCWLTVWGLNRVYLTAKQFFN